MKTQNRTKSTYPDYKAIQKLSTRIDHTINEEDFYTSKPNLKRINYIVSDINRHLKHIGGKF